MGFNLPARSGQAKLKADGVDRHAFACELGHSLGNMGAAVPKVMCVIAVRWADNKNYFFTMFYQN